MRAAMRKCWHGPVPAAAPLSAAGVLSRDGCRCRHDGSARCGADDRAGKRSHPRVARASDRHQPAARSRRSRRRALRARDARASSLPSTISARCWAIRPAASARAPSTTAGSSLPSGRPGEGDRLAGLELLCQRLSDPRPTASPPTDLGVLMPVSFIEATARHAAVRAVAASRSCGPTRCRSASASSPPIPSS